MKSILFAINRIQTLLSKMLRAGKIVERSRYRGETMNRILQNKRPMNYMHQLPGDSMRNIAVVLLLLFLQPFAPAHAQRTAGVIHVGVVLDAPSERNTWILKEFEKQLTDFFVPQSDVRFVPEYTMTADGTLPGIRSAIDKLMRDPEVEIVLALGAVSSYEISQRKNLSKPVIASYVLDAELQGLPMKNGASGVKNLNYISVSYSAKTTISLFRTIVPFKKLAVLIEPVTLEGIPQLRERVAGEAKSMGVDMVWVPVAGSAQDALNQMPSDVDAVYVTPLTRLTEKGFHELVDGLIKRKLPSFSFLGKSEVELGVLAAYAPGDDVTRRARRVAVNMQRIFNGEDAGTIPVGFSSPAQLTINMATARAIGFSPDWNTLTEAELINIGSSGTSRTLSLSEVVQEAVQVNLSIKAARKSVESGSEDVSKARASLLPQVNASATGILVRKETAEASFGLQPERQVQGEVTFQQSIYSDKAWANYSIQGHAQDQRVSDEMRQELDICLQAATSYLNVLRANTLARIQRSNLKLTISNLELAKQRERVGASGKSDVYRWESEVASSRRSVLDADAQALVAQIQVNQILNHPLEEQFGTREVALDDSSLITSEKRLFAYTGNPRTFGVFRDFMVQEGFAASPELKQIESAIAAEERAKTSASRSFWLPDVGLQASLKNTFSKTGAGAEGPALPPTLPLSFPSTPDLTWNIGVQISLPIFQGGGRIAALEQTSIDLQRLALQKQSIQLSIEQRVRASLHIAGASSAGIQQAKNAAEAARKNLELVTDAYSRGAASIITLIDAQNASLVANEAAENAEYDFVIDLMNVERAIGKFDFFRSAADKESFFSRLESYYRSAGVDVH